MQDGFAQILELMRCLKESSYHQAHRKRQLLRFKNTGGVGSAKGLKKQGLTIDDFKVHKKHSKRIIFLSPDYNKYKTNNSTLYW